MRRETRKHEKTESNAKNILYIGGSILGIGIIAFVITFVLYGNKMEEQSDISSGKIAELVKEAESKAETASTEMGKTVEESKNEMVNNVDNVIGNSTNTNTTKIDTKTNTNTVNNNVATNTVEKENKTNTVTTNAQVSENKTTTEVKFTKPVEGEISKQYAKDNLLYSATLEEWTTCL